MPEWQVELVVSSLNLFAIPGAFIAGYTSDTLGRTKTLAAASMFFILGMSIMTMSRGFGALLFGRALVGLGLGCGISIDPLYIAEISPPRYRGMLVSFSETSINIGILLGFVSVYLFNHVFEASTAWRVMLFCGVPTPLVMTYLALKVMPETPRWLFTQGRVEECKDVLRGLCNNDQEFEATMSDIQQSLKEAEADRGWDGILHPTPGIRLMLIVVIGVAIIQQATGIEAIMYYSNQIIKAGGITDTSTSFMVSMLMALWKTAVILVAARTLDEIAGRRSLLLYSLTGIAISELIMGIGLANSLPGLNIFGLFLFVGAFSLGLGPICWLFCSEIMPIEVRAKGMVIACSMNRLFSFIISDTFLSLVVGFERIDEDFGGDGKTSTGQAMVFFLFTFVTLLSFSFVYKMVPETKGKTLEEMSDYFEALALKHDGTAFPSASGMSGGAPPGAVALELVEPGTRARRRADALIGQHADTRR